MSLDSVSAVASTTTNHISQQDFLRILLTQLNAQDPLKPMDNTTFVTQLAQFSQLEQANQNLQSMNRLVSLQTSSQSMALLGKTVDLVHNGALVSGTVNAVTVSGTAPVLGVQPASGAPIGDVDRKDILNIR